MGDSFWHVTFGNFISFGSVALAFLAYWRDQKKQAAERALAHDTTVREQMAMHSENQSRLGAVLKFQLTQEEINKRRDEQIALMRIEAASLKEIAKATNRRLEMLEDVHAESQRRDRRSTDD